mmetsp:Transcript_23560/g.29691  ORF Transcript_23560/g.29691 Transcript_23560/m.29691 type:complete len:106 (-) Transcript_23560:882-1199(-)
MLIFVIFALITFCVGFVTWGYLWPKGINEVLFYGPIEREEVNMLNKHSGDNDPVQIKKIVKLDHRRILDKLQKQGSKIENLEEQMDKLQKQNEEILSILRKMKSS